jgi:hypothetical protein
LRRTRAARSPRASIATARIDGSASIHSIATDPAPAPTSQAIRPAAGQRRQCDGADLALGDLAVVLEQLVGRPAGASTRAPGGLDLDRDGAERADVAEVEAAGCRHAQTFARTSQRFEHGHARGAESDLGK